MDLITQEPVIRALRMVTAGQHASIEALLQLEPPVELCRYPRILAGFELFLSHWEPCVRKALPPRLHPWLQARSRLRFVRQDLRALGVPSLVAAPAMCHLAAEALARLRLPNAAAAFGSLYVLEGSALGGQLVARHLRDQHGLHQDNGAAYFAGWASDTGRMWREFGDLLAQEVGHDPESRETASRAAVQTFQALIHVFTEVLHERLPD